MNFANIILDILHIRLVADSIGTDVLTDPTLVLSEMEQIENLNGSFNSPSWLL